MPKSWTNLVRPWLSLALALGLVMTGVAIGSRVPGRGEEDRFPIASGLDYSSAPANYFGPLIPRAPVSIGRHPVDETAGPDLQPAAPASHHPAPGCSTGIVEDVTGKTCTESTQSSTYVATPLGTGVEYEGAGSGTGGQLFRITSGLRSITVHDEHGPGVWVEVYEWNGRDDDVAVEFCSTDEPYDVRDLDLDPPYVRVRIDTFNLACPSVATQGTITLTW